MSTAAAAAAATHDGCRAVRAAAFSTAAPAAHGREAMNWVAAWHGTTRRWCHATLWRDRSYL